MCIYSKVFLNEGIIFWQFLYYFWGQNLPNEMMGCFSGDFIVTINLEKKYQWQYKKY